MPKTKQKSSDSADSLHRAGSAPVWSETWDYEDNSMWEANSPYHDDGDAMVWRLKQRLVKNKIEWYEEHDADLMADPQNARTWKTLKAAKSAIAKDYAEIIEVEKLKAQNDKKRKRKL